MGTPHNQTTHSTRQRVFFVCNACACPIYGGSGGAVERLAGFVWYR
ncbi:TPA: hypothetical protein L2B17_005201 [Klebsiella oxytoca]|nr:hypothetical protein [Klebsiella oxytoca]HBN2674642.1 hypothetical protein [Klebsiella oxytoca]HBN2800121.1 hypothetical protein [Klebsiella oxytoca]